MGREYEGQLILASKGQFYDGAVPEGKINCSALDTNGERIFLGRSRPFEESLNIVIKKFTDLQIPPEKLILQDRAHLFLYLRCLTYGGEYEFDFQCSKCNKRVIVKDFDLENSLNVIYADDTMHEPFEVSLPNGDIITWKLLRGEDESAVERYANRLKEKGNRDSDPGYIFRLASRIVSINGKDCDNMPEVMEYITRLKGQSMFQFRNIFRNFQLGVDPRITYDCNWCEYTNDIMLPMGIDFFRFNLEAA